MVKETIFILILALAISLPLSYFFIKLRLPTLISFILAGTIVGPVGLSLIRDTHSIEGIAELGVILLMFLLGIEFSLKKLITYRKEVLVGGLLQVLLTGLIMTVFMKFLGYSIKFGLFFGFLIAFSSTAVVLKILMDRGELNTPYGRYCFGILLFQDLFVIGVMVFLPLLSRESFSLFSFIKPLLKSLIIIIILLAISLKIIPFLIEEVVKTRSREIFLITIFLLSLGTAFGSYKLGLSMSLGAFLAGMVISESDYIYQIMAELKPIKELFMIVFFISIGMLFDPSILFQYPFLTVFSFFFIFLLKTSILFVIVWFLSKNFRISLLSAFYLFQIGEFSFVLAMEGKKLSLFPSEFFYQLFIGISILTLMATPFVIEGSNRYGDFFLKRFSFGHFKFRKRLKGEREEKWKDHTIIVGFGMCGKNVAYSLKLLKIKYLILELNPFTVRKYKNQEPIYFGDATHPEILRKFGIERAKVLVIAIGDALSNRKIIQIARQLNPKLYILTRSQFVKDIEALLTLGADEVVSEELEASIQLFTKILEYYKVPKNVIQELRENLHKEHYLVLRKKEVLPSLKFWKESLSELFNLETYLVKEESSLIGFSIKEINLRAKTGATILAIQRGEELLINPSPDTIIQKGDILILTGEDKNLNKAFEYLDNFYSVIY